MVDTSLIKITSDRSRMIDSRGMIVKQHIERNALIFEEKPLVVVHVSRSKSARATALDRYHRVKEHGNTGLLMKEIL